MTDTNTTATKATVLARLRSLAHDPFGAFNWRYYRQAGGENRPAFHDIDETYLFLRLLDDSWNYEVYSDDLRVVLIVDVLRLMPFWLHTCNWLLTRTLMRHSEEAKQVLANIKKYSSVATGERV